MPSCRQHQRVDRLITVGRRRGPTLPGCDAGRRPRRGDGEITGRAVRGGPPRRGLAEGQTGAHARPRRAGRRVGIGQTHRQAVQHPSRRPRPRDRGIRHAGQDVQRDDRRDARLADRTVHRIGRRARPTAGWSSVRPEQVVEIAFDGVQTSSRYPGGMALRFARVLRYRDDKSARRGRHRRHRPGALRARSYQEFRPSSAIALSARHRL